MLAKLTIFAADFVGKQLALNLPLFSEYSRIPLTVQSPTGTWQGVQGTSSHVQQYLGIPYAEPPLQDLRWAAPTPKQPINDTYDASFFRPSCPQFDKNLPGTGFYKDAVREFWITNTTDENCLHLSIWTPLITKTRGLPVVVWLHGGGWQIGGANIPYLNPTQWIERSQKHIVVQINYRLNIFGFPRARGVHSQNLGMLDQRLGLEWVRDNIAFFGGDPQRITLWGQSAGAGSVDALTVAYKDQPIAKGLIMHSGTAYVADLHGSDSEGKNFTQVASEFDCAHSDPAKELDCMRSVPLSAIMDFMNSHEAPQDTFPTLKFWPQVDDVLVFRNYTERYLYKNYANLPAIIGTNSREGSSLVPYNPNGVDEEPVRHQTMRVFQCYAALESALRSETGTRTFRYYYEGNFSNISPAPWMGAYHNSELPLVFGTHSNFRGMSTEFERRVSEDMQDMWASFLEDPQHGLDRYGWEEYNLHNKRLMFFAHGGRSPYMDSMGHEDCD
ncbi:Nn.00g101610.m01.CDS01 [Neocucurbitaria sp. VM-36]